MIHLILSPAKNLDEKSALPFEVPMQLPEFLPQSEEIMQSLIKLGIDELKSLMTISDKIAKQNLERNRAWQLPYADEPSAKPALYLFDGDAYKGLDAYELDSDEIAYLNQHLSLLSGLYGLLRPLDTILPYRLEMGTKLGVGKHKDLYDFWGNALTDKLNERMAALGSDTLINLASAEYFGAIKSDKLNAKLITPKFLDYKNGDYKMISFFAKRARGLMARFCAVNDIKDAKGLKDFDMEGYAFDPAISDDSTWVFKRKQLEA